MEIRNEALKKFETRIDQAMIHIMKVEKNKKYSKRFGKLRTDYLKEFFNFEFNFQIFDFLGEKSKKVKNEILDKKGEFLKLEKKIEFYSSSDSLTMSNFLLEDPKIQKSDKIIEEDMKKKKKKKKFVLSKILKFKKSKASLEKKPMYILYKRIKENIKRGIYDEYLSPKIRKTEIFDENKDPKIPETIKKGKKRDSILNTNNKKNSSNKPKSKKRKKGKKGPKKSIFKPSDTEKIGEVEDLKGKLDDKKFSKFVLEKLRIEAKNKFKFEFEKRTARYVIMSILDYFFPVYEVEESEESEIKE